MIAVINLGLGNTGSILNMLRKAGAPATVTDQKVVIAQAERLILPGVGSFDKAIQRLDELGLRDIIERRVLVHKTPLLGICLGMQLLTERSEEGEARGLGWIPGETIKFRTTPGSSLKVPHMGWNAVQVEKEDALFAELGQHPRFYFVHSYHVVCEDAGHVIASAHHGDAFSCAIRNGHIAGVQFHPEKSHRYGLKVLKNFALGV